MESLIHLLAQESPAGGSPAAGGEGPSMLIWMIGIFAIFYFLMIRPQIKEQKRRREMLGQLKKNDRVMTNSGMFGQIVAINDDEVTLKVDESNNVRVRFARGAIAGLAGEAKLPEEKR